jgi:hypothetical protein
MDSSLMFYTFKFIYFLFFVAVLCLLILLVEETASAYREQLRTAKKGWRLDKGLKTPHPYGNSVLQKEDPRSSRAFVNTVTILWVLRNTRNFLRCVATPAFLRRVCIMALISAVLKEKYTFGSIDVSSICDRDTTSDILFCLKVVTVNRFMLLAIRHY